MRHRSARFALSTLMVALLGVPLVGGGASPAFAAALTKKALSPNGPALKLTFKNSGDQAAVTFSGLHNEVVKFATSAGTYAANCDVMVSLKKANGTVVSGPLCGGQAGTSSNVTLPADATYTLFVDPGVSPPGSLKLSLTSSGTIKSITPNAAAVTVTAAPSSTTDFGFIGVNARRLSASVASGTFANACDLHFSIIEPNGTTLLATSGCAGASGFIDSVANVGAGTYTLRVSNTGASSGTVKLKVSQFTDVAHPITANGAAVTTVIKSEGQNGALSFTGAMNQQVSFLVTASSLAAGSVHLQRPAGTSVSGTCTVANCFQDSVTLDAAGAWKIIIDPSSIYTGSITVQLYTCSDVDGGAITANGSAGSLTIASRGQNGSFTFTGAVGQQVSFLVTASSIAAGSVHLQRPAGTSVSGTCTVANCFQDSVTLDAAGTWKIIVDPTSTYTGSITIELYTYSDVDGGAITANGSAGSLTIASRGQNGSFTFTGAVGQQVSFLVTASSIAAGSVHLQRPAGTSVSGTCTVANCFQDSVTLDAAGTWKIIVDPTSTYTGSLTIELYTFSDVNGGAIVANGPAKSLTIASKGQNGSFTFTAAVGQQVSFLVTASSIAAGSVHLQRPAGTSVSGTCTVANCFQDSVTLDAAGTWKIIVDPSSTFTGSLTIELYTFSDVNGGAIVQGGSAKSLTIASKGQNGFFTFTGAMGQMAGFTVTASTIGGGSLHFQRPNGTSVSGTCVAAGCTQSVVTLDAAGTWKIIVDPSSTFTGSITIKLT